MIVKEPGLYTAICKGGFYFVVIDGSTPFFTMRRFFHSRLYTHPIARRDDLRVIDKVLELECDGWDNIPDKEGIYYCYRRSGFFKKRRKLGLVSITGKYPFLRVEGSIDFTGDNLAYNGCILNFGPILISYEEIKVLVQKY